MRGTCGSKGTTMPKLFAGDTVGMRGEITLISDDGTITVGLVGYDVPVTTRPEHLELIDSNARARTADRPVGRNRVEVTDLTGRTFGRLIVLCRAAKTGSGNAQWLCRCSCGGEL